MDNYKYGIKRNGKVLAKFIEEADRDVCFEAFEDAYEDCVFEAVELF